MQNDSVSSLDEPPSLARVAPAACRPANLADLDELVRLERAAFPREDWFPRHQFRELLETPAQHTVLVLPGDSPPRLAGNIVLFWRKNSPTGRIYNLVVDPALHKGGHGTRLLEAAEDAARARRCQRLVLEVRANNAPALAFYKRRGFRHFGTLAGYYPDGTAALRMEKFLHGAPCAQMELPWSGAMNPPNVEIAPEAASTWRVDPERLPGVAR
jgi:ribosomal protein S18 acetylase RimI-like enzyme